MSERMTIGLAAVVVASSASVAQAHITMIAPSPRTDAQKEGPCGAAGSVRGDDVTVFEPGETITVQWDETIDHDSHYRIAFDIDGDDDFVAPAGREDLYNSPTVLVDAIGDDVGGRYAYEVTLPDVECETCTLQLIQVMYGAGNYFQCADIALRRGGVAPEPDGGAPGYDGGPPVGSDAGGTPPGGYDGGAPGGGDGGRPVGPSPDAGGPAPEPDRGAVGGAAPHRAFVHGGCAAAGRGPAAPYGATLLAIGAVACCLGRRRRRS